MEWLQSLFGGESPALTLVLTFFAIAALLVASIWLFRKIAGGGSLKPSRNRQPRLSVTDAAIVDEKRRLVLVRRDNVEHLVMIGGPSDIVIEQNIVRTQPAAAPQQREVPREMVAAETAPAQTADRDEVPEEPREREAERVARLAALQRAAERTAAQERGQGLARKGEEGFASQGEVQRGRVASAAAAAAAVAPVPAYVEDEFELAGRQLSELDDEPFAQPHPASEPASLEIDFEDELERSLESQPAIQPAKEHSLESDLTAELSDDLDFARLLSEQEPVPAITTPEPSDRKKRQDDVEDEMQRLLDELASA